jgi:hypothetical protein
MSGNQIRPQGDAEMQLPADVIDDLADADHVLQAKTARHTSVTGAAPGTTADPDAPQVGDAEMQFPDDAVEGLAAEHQLPAAESPRRPTA